MTFYHIVYDLEIKYRNLQEAIHANYKGTWLLPTVPATTMQGEDMTVERVCAAKTIEDCVTSLRVYGPFKRCLAANEDAKSYSELMDEAYPVIVLELESDEIPTIPTEDQVPDVKYTNERWFLKPVKIKDSYVRWLDSCSILFEESATVNGASFGLCKKVTFLDEYKNKDHPWLNGRGHILASSCMDSEYEPFPPNLEPAVNQSIRYLTEIKDNFRLTVPNEIVKKWHYRPGDKINFRHISRTGESEVLWSELMDGRHQVVIPNNIVETFKLRNNTYLIAYEGNVKQICLADAARWDGVPNDQSDDTDGTAHPLCKVRTDKFDITITRSETANSTIWLYYAKLTTPSDAKKRLNWNVLLHVYEKDKAKEPTLPILQQLALEQLSKNASDLLNRAETDSAAYREIVNALRNLN